MNTTPEISGSGSGSLPEEQDNGLRASIERKLRRQLMRYGELGYSPESDIQTSGKPEIIIAATYDLLQMYEDQRIVKEPQPYYILQTAQQLLARRAVTLGRTNADLQTLGWAEIDQSGLGNPREDRKGFCLEWRRVPHKYIDKKSGKEVAEILNLPYYGTEDERKKMWEICTLMNDVLVARINIKQEAHFTDQHIEDSTGLSTRYFHDQISNLAIWELYKAPAPPGHPEKTVTGTEYKEGEEAGDMLQFAQQLWTIIGNSSRPSELRKLRETLGWKMLFPESGPGEAGISEKEKIWVGNVYKMKSEFRTFKSPIDDKDLVCDHTVEIVDDEVVKQETESLDGIRGQLTKYANPLAEYNTTTLEVLKNRVKNFLGGGVDENILFQSPFHRENQAVDSAAGLAWETAKVWDTTSILGWRIAPDKDGEYEDRLRQNRLSNTEYKGFYVVAEFGTDVTLDTMKGHFPWLFQLMYYGKGREAGPLGPSLFSYEGFSTDITRTITFKGADDKNYTWYEAMWWGIPVKKADGSVVTTTRTSEMPWYQAGRRVLTKCYLPQFMALRENVGAFLQATSTGLNLEAFADEGTLFTLWKIVSLATTPQKAANGVLHEYHGKEEELYRKTDEQRMNTMIGIIKGLESYTSYERINMKGSYKPSPNAIIDIPLATAINRAIQRFNARCGQVPGYPSRKLPLLRYEYKATEKKEERKSR